MTYEEAKELHNGDEVLWNDPDEGACSRVYEIQHIDVGADNGDMTVISIRAIDGSVLECFLGELG